MVLCLPLEVNALEVGIAATKGVLEVNFCDRKKLYFRGGLP